MLISKKKEEVAAKYEVVGAVCNMCGESCSLGHAYGDGTESDPISYGGLINCEVQGGYNSTPGNGVGALDDMTKYTFSLCEFCLDYMFGYFTIPPKVYSYISSTEIEWQSAAQRVSGDKDNGPGWYVCESDAEDEGYVGFFDHDPTDEEIKQIHTSYVRIK